MKFISNFEQWFLNYIYYNNELNSIGNKLKFKQDIDVISNLKTQVCRFYVLKEI